MATTAAGNASKLVQQQGGAMSARRALGAVLRTPRSAAASQELTESYVQVYKAALVRARTRPQDPRLERLGLQAEIGTGGGATTADLTGPSVPAGAGGTAAAFERRAPPRSALGSTAATAAAMPLLRVVPNQNAAKAHFQDAMTVVRQKEIALAAAAEYRRLTFVVENARRTLQALRNQRLGDTATAAAAEERLARARALAQSAKTAADAARANAAGQVTVAAAKTALRTQRDERAAARLAVQGTADPEARYDMASSRLQQAADTKVARAGAGQGLPSANGRQARTSGNEAAADILAQTATRQTTSERWVAQLLQRADLVRTEGGARLVF